MLNCCRCKSIMPALFVIKIFINFRKLISIYKTGKYAKCAYLEINTS